MARYYKGQRYDLCAVRRIFGTALVIILMVISLLLRGELRKTRRIMESTPLRADSRAMWVSDDPAGAGSPSAPAQHGDTLFSPGGKTFCVATLNRIHIYSARRNDLLGTVSGRVPVSYSPDGKRLLTADVLKGSLEVLDVTRKALRDGLSFVWIGSPDVPFKSAAFSPEGRRIVAAYADGSVRIWNSVNGAEREVLHWDGASIDEIWFNADGNHIFAFDRAAGKMCEWGPFELSI